MIAIKLRQQEGLTGVQANVDISKLSGDSSDEGSLQARAVGPERVQRFLPEHGEGEVPGPREYSILRGGHQSRWVLLEGRGYQLHGTGGGGVPDEATEGVVQECKCKGNLKAHLSPEYRPGGKGLPEHPAGRLETCEHTEGGGVRPPVLVHCSEPNWPTEPRGRRADAEERAGVRSNGEEHDEGPASARREIRQGDVRPRQTGKLIGCIRYI